jgi:predicted phosphodiesterase
MKEILEETLVIAVRGNNDGDVYQLMTLFSNYGWRLYHDPSIVEIDGRRLLIMHGYNGVEYTENLAKGFANNNFLHKKHRLSTIHTSLYSFRF